MSFIGELKRRNVFRVAVLYLVASWLILQVADLLFDAIDVPDEWLRFIIVMLILGLPVVLIFSWVYEVTPEGIKREKDIDRGQSITAETGQRVNRMIAVLLVVTIGVVALDRLIPETAMDAPSASDAALGDEAPVQPGGPTPPERSIAVLPFKDLSPAGDQGYFSDGIAEEILNVLVRIEGLQVASRTTSWGFKGQEALGIPKIAESLNVNHILEGSVRKSGDMVRVTAQLIDASEDKHLWSETFDRQLTAENIFAIQDEIAAAIADELGVLIDDGSRAVSRAPDTADIDAYELFLRGQQRFVARDNLNEAISFFEQSIAMDPEFARAWAFLGATAQVAPEWGYVGHDYDALARTSAERAIELDPDLALPYAVLGALFASPNPIDYEKMLWYYGEAIARDPREATVYLWRGITYIEIGYFDRAIEDFGRCLQLDPAYTNCQSHLAMTYLLQGDSKTALEEYEFSLQNGFTGNVLPFMFLLAAKGELNAVLFGIGHWNDGINTPHAAKFEYRAYLNPPFDYEAERVQLAAAYVPTGGTELRSGARNTMTSTCCTATTPRTRQQLTIRSGGSHTPQLFASHRIRGA